MKRQERIIQALQTYLDRHPACADTLTGIRHWWLRNLQPPPTEAELEDAVARLLASGRLQRRRYGGSRELYVATPRYGKNLSKERGHE